MGETFIFNWIIEYLRKLHTTLCTFCTLAQGRNVHHGIRSQNIVMWHLLPSMARWSWPNGHPPLSSHSCSRSITSWCKMPLHHNVVFSLCLCLLFSNKSCSRSSPWSQLRFWSLELAGVHWCLQIKNDFVHSSVLFLFALFFNRETFTYYFADFIHKRGGGSPFLSIFDTQTPFLGLLGVKFLGSNLRTFRKKNMGYHLTEKSTK